MYVVPSVFTTDGVYPNVPLPIISTDVRLAKVAPVGGDGVPGFAHAGGTAGGEAVPVVAVRLGDGGGADDDDGDKDGIEAVFHDGGFSFTGVSPELVEKLMQK